ncbi:MAG: hypothetical protein H0U57_09400 [Tatlockia sp.]|nr:hypothetical protein [Tatlockia sp.]
MYQRHEIESNFDLDRYRLIELGVPEFLLKPNEFDFNLLFQRLYASMSDNANPLRINAKWQLEALSGESFYYHLLKEREHLRDNFGLSPYHYTAWSGNTEGLDWIFKSSPESFYEKDYSNNTLLNYAANSGNLNALDWVFTKFPDFFSKFTKELASFINCIARSGNVEALNWVYTHFPHYLYLKGYNGFTAVHYIALSNNHEALNHALSLSKNPESWDLLDSY